MAEVEIAAMPAAVLSRITVDPLSPNGVLEDLSRGGRGQDVKSYALQGRSSCKSVWSVTEYSF